MCFGEANVEHLRTLRLELTSAKAYQQMVGVSALANFVHLWMARLLLICSEFEAAVPALRAVRSMQPFARYNYNVSLIDLEIGFCLLRLGKLEAALAEVQSALQVDLGKLHDDDRLVAAWIRNELLEALPQMGDSAKARVELESERNAFEAGCTGLREVLDGLAPQPHILRPTIVLPRAAS
jgi:tetratricopeptide (TPR) repeat protein